MYSLSVNTTAPADRHQIITWYDIDYAGVGASKVMTHLHGQYHACWCLGSLRRQVTCCHDIDYISHQWFTWSIPCLQVPWLLASPSHLQSWHWLYQSSVMTHPSSICNQGSSVIMGQSCPRSSCMRGAAWRPVVVALAAWLVSSSRETWTRTMAPLCCPGQLPVRHLSLTAPGVTQTTSQTMLDIYRAPISWWTRLVYKMTT